MAIIANFGTFRWYACDKVVSTVAAATFTDIPAGSGDIISRAAGSFFGDGVRSGMVTRPSGSASNDGFLFPIESITPGAPTQLFIEPGQEVVPEGPVACTFTSYWVDSDGYEEWPGPNGHTNLVRSGGFDGGISGMPQPWYGSATLTVNASAADAVAGTDEYHWYLSQRTDDPVKQYLDIAPYTNVVGSTYSGSVVVEVSALGLSETGMSVADPTPTQMTEAFRHCYIYCVRVSDGAIQWLDLLQEIFSGH